MDCISTRKVSCSSSNISGLQRLFSNMKPDWTVQYWLQLSLSSWIRLSTFVYLGLLAQNTKQFWVLRWVLTQATTQIMEIIQLNNYFFPLQSLPNFYFLLIIERHEPSETLSYKMNIIVTTIFWIWIQSRVFVVWLPTLLKLWSLSTCFQTKKA